MLQKKSNFICYHAIRESVAMGEMLTGHVSTHHNPADVATKLLAGGQNVIPSLAWYSMISLIIDFA